MLKIRMNPYAVMESMHAVKSRIRKVWKPVLFVIVVFFDVEKYLLPFFPKLATTPHSGAWTRPIPLLKDSEHATYDGDTLGGEIMHGQGKLLLANGTAYEGKFKFGNLSKGKIIYPDNSMYEGAIVGWKESGVGKITYPDGSVETRTGSAAWKPDLSMLTNMNKE